MLAHGPLFFIRENSLSCSGIIINFVNHFKKEGEERQSGKGEQLYLCPGIRRNEFWSCGAFIFFPLYRKKDLQFCKL